MMLAPHQHELSSDHSTCTQSHSGGSEQELMMMIQRRYRQTIHCLLYMDKLSLSIQQFHAIVRTLGAPE